MSPTSYQTAPPRKPMLTERFRPVKPELRRASCFFPCRCVTIIAEARVVIEMRTYKTKPGKRAQFIDIFRSRSIPAHAEIGMKILGPLLSVEDADTFFF